MATRRERVIVSLDDDYSGPMARCVGATALLNAELDRLAGQAVVSNRFARTVQRDMDGVTASAKKADSSINQLSGRLSLLGRFMAVFGPGAVPVGAVAVAGIAGIATQLGLAAAGGLSLVVALQGVGDAVKAVEAARLEPTAANIDKAEQAMAKLAPEARAFVDKFQEIRPVLGDLQKASARGWLPGFTEALDSLDKAAPRVEKILEAVSTAGGDVVADSAASLAGDRWRDFFEYIESEAPQAVTDLSTAIGSLGHGLAELLMITDPASDGLRGWLLDATSAFDDWATALDDADVEGFFDYLSETGPKVAAAAGAIADAVLQIAEAAAPLGGPVLDSLTAVGEAVAAIADSPLGTPLMTAVTAMSALSLASRGLNAGLAATNAQLAALGAQGPKTATALGLVQKAGMALVGIQIGTQILDGLRASAVGAAPDVDKLTEALQKADGGALTDALGGDLSELLKARTSDLNGFEKGVKSLSDKAGIFGDAVEIFSPQLKYMGVSAEQAEQATASLDAALTMLITTAGPDGAQRAFADLAKSQGLSAAEQAQLLDMLPGYSSALAATGAAADIAASSSDDLAASQDLIASKLLASRDAARESAKSFLDFSDSLAGDKFSLSGWLDAFEAQVTALANFRDNIQTLRERGLKGSIIDELIAQGPAAAQAVAGLAGAGQGAIDRLNGAMKDARGEIRGMGKDARNAGDDVDRLGNAKATPLVDLNPAGFDAKRAAVDDALGRLGGKKTTPTVGVNDAPFQAGKNRVTGDLISLGRQTALPKINVQAGDSLTQLGRIKAAIDAIRSKTVTIQTIRTGQGLGKRADVADAHPADGGTIPRFGGRPIRSAAGSTVPDDGGGYRDYLLYMLAPLEEVISNRRGQADNFRPELKDINAGLSRAAVVERMLMRGLTTTPRRAANGGTTGGKAGKSSKNKSYAGGAYIGWDMVTQQVIPDLKAWISALEDSKSSLEDETKSRQELAQQLGDTVAGKLTTGLFGDTNVWSAGGSLEDAINQLMADSASAQAYSANVAKLQSLGLDDATGALSGLLSQADPATVANIAATATAEQIAAYEQAYQQRTQSVTAVNNQVQQAQLAAVEAAQAITNAELARINAQLEAANALQSGNNALMAEAPAKTGATLGRVAAKANNKGAAKASFNIRRG